MNFRDIKENIGYFIFSSVKNFKAFFGRVNWEGLLSNTSDLTGLLPIIGYGIVMMSFIDFIYVIVPPQLQNPEWELNAISLFTEHSWVFLIGLGFVFTRYFRENEYDIRFLEIVFLRFIRWVILLMGIAFFALIPLTLLNTQRVLKVVNDQITEQRNNRVEQITQIEKRLASGVSAEQIKLFAKNINMSPDDLKLPTPQLKNTIQKNLASAKKTISQEAALNQRGQWKNRWKSSLRTVIALLIIGVTFVIVWLQIGRACI
ncbi:MAG: HpsJ family protein [Dolichospermum sp. BR01]|nr:HpsJ family protein [Dolichospermum sp. BR01]